MQAIVTKYYGPTNTKGSYVKAWCDAGSVKVGWEYAIDMGPNHAAAVRALLAKLGWGGSWQLGSAPEHGCNVAYVAVCLDDKSPVRVSVA